MAQGRCTKMIMWIRTSRLSITNLFSNRAGGRNARVPSQRLPRPNRRHPNRSLRGHTPYTIHPTQYTIHFTLYTIHHTIYTIHLTPYTIHHTPYTIHRTLYTLHPTTYNIFEAPRPRRRNFKASLPGLFESPIVDHLYRTGVRNRTPRGTNAPDPIGA